jgi:hypothetical protein
MSATYPDDNAVEHTDPTPNVLVRAAFGIERADWLDPLTRVLAPVAGAAVATPARRAFLEGRWLGHSAHPFFVTVPLGVWTGVAALDIFGGPSTRETCRTLTASVF